ncbi:diacylglycerol kinase family protein [Antrihabitans sp. YC2-6]|uniref:diacylglycerol/lipid kinase family protein n=1 Tax=Antrihabitans sp. YC2-6 TaxID=2799498 RepID=UPI0018F612BF|nr:diacylglycerol kinase family protein [Antrihabitans sp. YC2-6]MBJ8347733.1 hypothetical protein [Antrihabitans sp. YC2-6]
MSASDRKRLLLVVNPYATNVSDTITADVVHRLRAGYDVQVVTTEARGHAIELGRAATGIDLVVALGGDGTVNEIVNGIVGLGIPLSALPGGSTNVICRTLGIPRQIGPATQHLLRRADDFAPRPIDLGTVNGRRFVFACGAGLDATTARRVEARPELKSRFGPFFFTYAAITGFLGEYMGDKVRLRIMAGGREIDGVTAVVQNSSPFTYFQGVPVQLSKDVALDDGSLAVIVLRRASPVDVPFLMGRVLVDRLGGARSHRHVDELRDITSARIVSTGLLPFAVQVDGDYIGDFTELDLGIERKALSVIA